MGFVQATVDVGVIFVLDVLIKCFELIVIHFALIRNLFYPDTPGKLVKIPVLLLCRIFVFRCSDVIQNLVHERSTWKYDKSIKNIFNELLIACIQCVLKFNCPLFPAFH
jgi:hypothetical protein